MPLPAKPSLPPRAASHQPGTHDWTMLSAHPGDHLSLMPGQLYFGSKAATVRTLLGSCVAITLWHPQRKLGGMCHYLLPSRPNPPQHSPEGRFGEEALAMMVRTLKLAGTQPQEYEAQLYGGADTQPDNVAAKTGIGERNIEAGWQLIDHYGFALQAVDVGDNVPRTVRLVIATGEVDMRRGHPLNNRKS